MAKRTQIQIRLTDEEKVMIQTYAETEGLSISEYVRKASLNYWKVPIVHDFLVRLKKRYRRVEQSVNTMLRVLDIN